MRTALCLCGGGIVGGMYEIGALAALDDFFSAPRSDGSRVFSVNDFDVYVGTSAGAFLATVLSSGIRARRLFRAALDDDPNFFPANRTDLAACRVVVRQGSKDATDLFLDDLRRAVEALDRTGGGVGEHKSSFHH